MRYSKQDWITCLFSHSCAFGICHAKGRCASTVPCRSCRLAVGLLPYKIGVLVDPFRPGDRLKLRMQTFQFDVLVFLISEESLASEPCAIERATAKTNGRPIFCVHASGVVPEDLRQRLYLKGSELDQPDGIDRLARAIRTHVGLQRHLTAVLDTEPSRSRQAARDLYWDDPSVLAEYLTTLEKTYPSIRDEYTRCWVAWAIQRTQAPQAAPIVERLSVHEAEAYPRVGLKPLAISNPLRRATK